MNRLSKTASAEVSAGSSSTLFSMRIPSGAKFVLNKVGCDLNTISAWGYCYFSILKNGIPVWEPYIYDQVGMIYDPRDIGPIVFEPGSLFEIIGYNGYSSSVKMGFSFDGFFSEV